MLEKERVCVKVAASYRLMWRLRARAAAGFVSIMWGMRRKIPSLQALACFEAAARHRATRAAQELALTQGAVSRQLTALEDFVGVALFKRTRHGVTLTECGRDYAAQVALRLQALEQDTLEVMSTRGAAAPCTWQRFRPLPRAG